jgi:dTDP-4-dehydrorhamnose 3,5-epimerase
MEIERLSIPELILIKPQVFADERGYFFESFNEEKFAQKSGVGVNFVQDNESLSNYGVLRGLHFQNPPYAQGKLVRVIRGSVQDVAVDIRRDSPTFGQHCSVILSGENKYQLFIPEGFAHGFLVLEDHTIFSYKCTNFYHRESEGSLKWNDPDLHIVWGINAPALSEKDRNTAVNWKSFESHF